MGTDGRKHGRQDEGPEKPTLEGKGRGDERQRQIGGSMTVGMRGLRSHSSGEMDRRREKGIDRSKYDRHHERPEKQQLLSTLAKE